MTDFNKSTIAFKEPLLSLTQNYVMSLVLCFLVTSLYPQLVQAHDENQPGLMVMPDYLQTHHDKIPRFCNIANAGAAIVTNLSSGNWSNPSIWPGGVVPSTNARIQISTDTSVTYDLNSTARLDCIEIHGALFFDPSQSTTMYINEITVMPSGSLTIGTVAQPIASAVQAKIIFNDSPLKTGTVQNPGIDPSMYGKGLLAFGSISIHGAIKNPTYVRFAGDLKAGDTSIGLAQEPHGWKIGDRLLIPGTNYVDEKDLALNSRWLKPEKRQWEERLITAINGDQISLDQPLQFDHLCARDADAINFQDRTIARLPNSNKLCGHLGNLSRNVIFRSENTFDTLRQGHTAFFFTPAVDVRYAEFNSMGRTTTNLLDNTEFTNGILSKIGSNQVGRYPIHLHHVYGPTPPHPSGYQFTLTGNAVVGSPKWGLAIHDSHYGLANKNVIYNAIGAALVTEDGSESFNHIEENFSVVSFGPEHFDAPYGVQEGRFNALGRFGGNWFRGPHNYFRNNVAANVHEGFPFFVDSEGGNIGSSGESARIPLAPGTKTFLNSNIESTIIANLHNLEFSGNEVYVTIKDAVGIWLLWQEFRLKNGIIWNSALAFDIDYGNAKIENPFIRGYMDNGRFLRIHNGNASIYGGNLQGLEYVHTGLDNRIFGLTVTGGYYKNKHNFAQTTSYEGGINFVPQLYFDTRFDPVPGSGLSIVDYLPPGFPHSDFFKTRTIHRFYNFQGESGQNFQTYHSNQHPNSTAETCPTAGLTNSQCWAQYQVANQSEVAPCTDSTSHPEINGFTCPISPYANTEEPNVAILSPKQNATIYSSQLLVRYELTGATQTVSKVVITLSGQNYEDLDRDGFFTISNAPEGLQEVAITLFDQGNNVLRNLRRSFTFHPVDGAFCGDGIQNQDELCDRFGNVGCNTNMICRFDCGQCLSAPAVCGDNQRTGEEICDGSIGCRLGQTCSSDCTHCNDNSIDNTPPRSPSNLRFAAAPLAKRK